MSDELIWTNGNGRRLVVDAEFRCLSAWRDGEFRLFYWGTMGLLLDGAWSYEAAVRKAINWLLEPTTLIERAQVVISEVRATR